jgi:plasmid stabilization system protein ParE
MTVRFLEPAENEFKEAIKYYNEQSEGLGYEFALEIRKTIERIIHYPEAWTPLSKRTRRCRCNNFPYGVIYYIKDDVIIIVAVMHFKRKPTYWKDRI